MRVLRVLCKRFKMILESALSLAKGDFDDVRVKHLAWMIADYDFSDRDISIERLVTPERHGTWVKYGVEELLTKYRPDLVRSMADGV